MKRCVVVEAGLLHVLVVAAAVVALTEAFISPLTPRCCRSLSRPIVTHRESSCFSSLYMAKKRGGGLSFIVEDGDGDSGASPPPPPPRIKRSQRAVLKMPNKKSNSGSSGSGSSSTAISPDLLKFMEGKESASSSSSSSATSSTSSDNVAVDESSSSASASSPTFVSFDTAASKSSSLLSPRRAKQSMRQQLDEERAAAVKAIVQQLESTLASGEKTMIPNLLTLLEQLTDMSVTMSSGSSSSSLKQLLTTKQRLDYRLAWVGSDAAVTHTGTGLHKVALARLQEVFLSLTGQRSGRVQYTEVIRILGPFPNVKNTLQGASSSSSLTGTNGNTETWKIIWDSMIDGTGKELLAGKAENTQTVLLDVCYSDEQVIVATLPGQSLRDDNGQHVLLFLRDENMDDKLESLRVA